MHLPNIKKELDVALIIKQKKQKEARAILSNTQISNKTKTKQMDI